MAKLRKNERNEKEKDIFLFSFPSASNFGGVKVTKKREKCKRKARFSFFKKKDVSLYYNADSVLALHQCQEALYVKSRCLAKLERYQEADAVNVLMGDVFDMSTPDAKVLYMIAMLNELHIGDNGLILMQELIKAKPKYDKGILSLRYLMKRKGLVLVKTSDVQRELVDDFNGDMSDEVFAQKLKTAREKAPKAVEYLLRLIKKQEFSAE